MVAHLGSTTRRRALVILAIALVAWLALVQRDGRVQVATASDGTPIYLQCSGPVTKITGTVQAKGYLGAVAVTKLAHGITAPYDEATGAPLGKRRHAPIVFTKEVDRATPALYKVMFGNENLKCSVSLMQTGASGVVTAYLRITLNNARVVDVSTSAAQAGNDTEHWSLVYQGITWQHVPTGQSVSTTWGG